MEEPYLSCSSLDYNVHFTSCCSVSQAQLSRYHKTLNKLLNCFESACLLLCQRVPKRIEGNFKYESILEIIKDCKYLK